MKWLMLAIVLAASPAWAQSKRYPPEPKDRDRDAEAHSNVWDQALQPGTREYGELVRQARQHIDAHDPDRVKQAIEPLDRAIALLAAPAEAYALRGDAYLMLRDWARCADDFASAEARAHDAERAKNLGICEGRAGRYARAESTFTRALTSATAKGDLLMRLGEVRIAMGKLDEAIDALDAALEAGDGSQLMMHWLLAVAYDRERRPSDASEHATKAAAFDRQFTGLESPQYPFLGDGEREYLLALAYQYSTPQSPAVPEKSLMYFRRFARLAPHSPWRRRAEEHVHDLAAIELPSTVERRGGNAALEVDATRPLLHKAIPALRACVAKLPNTVFEIAITRTGPRTPDTARDRSRFNAPPTGITVLPILNAEAIASDAIAAAQRCIEPILERVVLPVPQERDTYYRIAFLVIAP